MPGIIASDGNKVVRVEDWSQQVCCLLRDPCGLCSAICDEGITPTPTVNSFSVLVQPNTFPTGVPFRKGTALASVSVFACPNSFVASGVPPPCDFGSAGPTVISIK